MYSGTIIVSFDGNVYGGKTTLISELKKQHNFVVIPEYSFFLKESDFKNLDFWPLQRKYMLVEKTRIKLLEDGKINLVDRSFLSQAAHVWAVYKIGLVDMRKLFFKNLSNDMKKNKVILPNLFVYVKCLYSISKKRLEVRELSVNKKNTAPFFIEKNYFKEIESFLGEVILQIPSIIIDTSNLDKHSAVERISHKINKETKTDGEEVLKIVEARLFQN